MELNCLLSKKRKAFSLLNLGEAILVVNGKGSHARQKEKTLCAHFIFIYKG